MWTACVTSLVALISIVLNVGPAATQPAPTPASRVAVLAPFVGEFVIDGHWDDGTPLHAKDVCEWTLNKTHLAEKTFVGSGASEYQRYQTFLSYDAKHDCLVAHNFAVDGAISEYRVDTEDGKTFKFGFTPLHEGETSQVRQVLTFVDKDSYTWLVEVMDAGKWKQIMNGTWNRAK